ncbi:hypothetical protein RCG67_14000 [Kocuria sp. CPCC 205292]|uniref:hypothetical protein n=1 Tax=Kocuria cellulosilytica TaxID=3071451 RepID=UPI0034D475A9
MLDALAAQQARLLQLTIAQADISVFQLWWHYFSLGGDVGQLEIEAYLHQALHLPRLDRQLLDHAASELIND